MPRPKRPWWRVDADTDESDKLARLPNDQARWAWFRMGCRAKTQRQMGVFAGTAHLKALLGVHGRYVNNLVDVGLIHVWPVAKATCERCWKEYSGAAQKGDLVVHDYLLMQRDPTAAERQHAARNGHDEVTPLSPGGHAVVTGNVTPLSRALSPSPSTSPSDQSSEEPYHVPAEVVEPYRTLEELTRFPAQRVGRAWIGRLDGLSDRRTVEAVVAGMVAVAPSIETQPPSPEQLVMAVQKHLEPFDRTARNGSKPKGRGPDLSEVDRAFGDR